MTAWLYILAGTMLGSVGDYLMKAYGFANIWMATIAISLYIANIAFWGIAIKTLPLGSAYAVWTSLGTLAALMIGVIFFGETITSLKIIFILMLLIGAIGLTMLKA